MKPQNQNWHRITNDDDGMELFTGLVWVAGAFAGGFALWYGVKLFVWLFFRAM